MATLKLKTITNGKETTIFGGNIRNIWAASENGAWAHKDLSAFISIDHCRHIILNSRVTGGGQTGIGHEGITPGDTASIITTTGARFYANGEGSGDMMESWEPLTRAGIIVFSRTSEPNC